MEILSLFKNTKSSCLLTNMNLFYASFGILTIFLISGGALTNAHRRPCRESPPGSDDDRELKLVHVVMRHGIRAPVSLYPNDPHQGNDFPPNGRGMITMKGIEGVYKLGKILRQRFDKFLGSRFNISEFKAESTGVERAQATIMAVNAGLWPPAKEQRFSKDFAWMPVPVFMTNLDDDMLLLVAKDCPQYNFERKRIEESAEVQAELEKYKDMMAIIQEKSGQTMKTFDDIGDIYATMLAEKSYGLDLPDWVLPHFDRMETATAFSFVIKAYNDKMQRLKGGVLLKKILSDWRSKVAGTLTPKMFLYGGHDSTIANLLSALKVFDPQVPNYAMSIILQMSFDKSTKQHGIEIFTKNSTAEYIQHQLPGCEMFCPLEDIIKLTSNVIPVDWEAECATDDENYTAPPFEGP